MSFELQLIWLILSILTLGASACAFYKGKSRWMVIILLLLGAASLRVLFSMDPFLHPWDERYHALVAKNLMNHSLMPTLYDSPVLHFDYKVWTDNHVWLHKQPLSLWLIAGSYKVFGVSALATRIPSILLTTLATYGTYRIGYRLFSSRIGYYAALLFTINGLILDNASGRTATDHIDAVYLSFITLAIWAALEYAHSRKFWINLFCGVLIGCAVLTKWLPALIVGLLWLIATRAKGHSTKSTLLNGLVLIATIIAVALPWQLHINANFPQEATWESHLNFVHLFEAVEGREGGFFFHWEEIRIHFGELIYLPLLFLGWISFKKGNWHYWFLFIWFIIPMIFFSFVATKMPSYILFTCPALFINVALCARWIKRHHTKGKFKFPAYLVLILLIVLPLRLTIERSKVFDKLHHQQEWHSEIMEFIESNKLTDRSIVYNTEHPIELMFESECVAYSKNIDEAAKDSLRQKGYVLIDYSKYD